MKATSLLQLFLGMSIARAPVLAQSARPAQHEPTLVCLGPLNDRCQLDTLSGPDSVQLLFRLEWRDTHAPITGWKVAFTSSGCCVFPSADTTNALGLASTFWLGRIAVDTPRVVQARAESSGVPAVALAQLRGRKPGGRVFHLTFENERQTWFAGVNLPKPVRVWIQTDSMNRETCEKTGLTFRTYPGGTVAPDTARGRWVRSKKGTSPADSACLAEATWKLADALGEQHMLVSVPGGKTDSLPNRVTAVARKEPSVVVGLAAATVRRPGKESNGTRPVAGVEFPFFFSAVRQRLRLFAGTSIEKDTKFGRENYFGVLLLPLLGKAPRERYTIQLNLGVAAKMPGHGGSLKKTVYAPYFGVTINGSDIAAAVLGPK